MRNFVNLSGTKIGKWSVLNVAEKRNNVYYFMCRCDCGTERKVARNGLSRGRSLSCGCTKNVASGMGTLKRLYGVYRRNAQKRKIIFALSIEEYTQLIQEPCYYCGDNPRFNKAIKNHGGYYANGVDRRDNTIGYVKGNCVPCCSTCNYMKRSMSVDDFINHIKKIGRYRNEVC